MTIDDEGIANNILSHIYLKYFIQSQMRRQQTQTQLCNGSIYRSGLEESLRWIQQQALKVLHFDWSSFFCSVHPRFDPLDLNTTTRLSRTHTAHTLII